MAKARTGIREFVGHGQEGLLAESDADMVAQLVRLVRTAEGGVAIDPTGKAAGRGAYLHDRRSCWQAALANSGLENALRLNLDEAERGLLRAHGEQYDHDE